MLYAVPGGSGLGQLELANFLMVLVVMQPGNTPEPAPCLALEWVPLPGFLFSALLVVVQSFIHSFICQTFVDTNAGNTALNKINSVRLWILSLCGVKCYKPEASALEKGTSERRSVGLSEAQLGVAAALTL